MEKHSREAIVSSLIGCLPRTTTLEEAKDTRLSAMCDLSEGWDGNKAQPISRDIIEFVSGIVQHLDWQPELYPTVEGGVQLQYENEDKTYLEMVFAPDSIMSMRVKRGNINKPEFEEFSYESEEAIVEYIIAQMML